MQRYASSAAASAAKFFPPYRLKINLAEEAYSPSLLQKITYAGGNNPSYRQARHDLIELAELELAEKDIRKFTDRIGRELKACQDERVQEFNKTGAVPRTQCDVPTTVAVMVDAGRAQIRQENAGRGVHGKQWVAPRYGTLRSLASQPHAADPHPDVPHAFLDLKHVKALTGQIVKPKGRTPQPQACAPDSEEPTPPSHPSSAKSNVSPALLLQTCVAAVASAEDFGQIVATEAVARGFHQAPHKAFVADGEHANWSIHEDFFFDFLPILDFIHCLGHLFEAASAAKGNSPEAWTLYQALVTAAWKGQPRKILGLLQTEADRLGPPLPKPKDTDPRKIVADAIGYIGNNAARMNYPEYRKKGLPISSCHIESLIKQFNVRVKATDKFWVTPCLDNVLQVRAAWLSDDARWKCFWKERSAWLASRTRPYRRAAG